MYDLFIPRSFVLSIQIVFIVLILVGNGLVVALIIFTKTMHTVTNAFLVSLSMADLLVGLVAIPLTLLEATGILAGGARCYLAPYIQTVSVTASMYSLIGVAADRFRAIAQPSKPPFTSKYVKYIISGIWIFAFLYSGIHFQPWAQQSEQDNTENDTESNITSGPPESIANYCNYFEEDTTSDLYVRILDMGFLFIFPAAILTVLYGIIMKRLKTHFVLNSASQMQKKKVLKLLIIVVVAFFICWAPFHTFELVHDSADYFNTEDDESESEENETHLMGMRFAFSLLAMANSWINPILYAAMNTNVRQELRNFYRRIYRGNRVEAAVQVESVNVIAANSSDV